jgi:hypothetical protein
MGQSGKILVPYVEKLDLKAQWVLLEQMEQMEQKAQEVHRENPELMELMELME